MDDRRRAVESLLSLQPRPLDFAATSRDHGLVVVESDFAAHSGDITPLRHARISLALGAPASVRQNSRFGRLEGIWRRGDIVVGLPDTEASLRCDATRMVGCAIDVDRLEVDPLQLRQASLRFYKDPVVSALLVAMRQAASVYGADCTLCDEAAIMIVDRLVSHSPGREPGRTPPLTGARLDRVTALIDASLDTDLSVATLASEAGQSRNVFIRAFRQATGLTPFAFITERRMLHACNLLGQGMSVTAVAAAVGYANPSKFAGAFRRVHGIAPRDWCR